MFPQNKLSNGKGRKENAMSVNGITTNQAANAYAYSSTSVKESANVSAGAESSTAKTSEAAVYEPSQATDTVKKTYTRDTALVNQLKADAQARANNLQSMVEKLMTKQATTYGNATDIWSFLREGKFEVDPETKAQAQRDIAEDGYWGVEQTSDRIVSFATALTGGDPDKLDEMMAAFKKGYAQAEKTWGGELPEISKRTFDAVLEKFNKLKEENGLAVDQAQAVAGTQATES